VEDAKTSRARNNRNLILDVTERLMLEEGYAAVSTRRVAKDAGLKAPLVHYYFKTTDDLFLEVYHRAVTKELEKLDGATSSEDALRVIWDSYRNSERTALAVEFMALANHRKSIGAEIARATEEARAQRARALEQLVDMDSVVPAGTSAEALAVLLIGIARTLVMEEGVGISLGHEDAIAFVEWWLERLAAK
jgi:AcrR family transcriptional regulator